MVAHPSDTHAASGGGPGPGAADLGRQGEGERAAGEGDQCLPLGQVGLEDPFLRSCEEGERGNGVGKALGLHSLAMDDGVLLSMRLLTL